MNIKKNYLTLCILGTILPLYQFLPWLVSNGINIQLFIQELFSTHIGGFFGLDVIVSAIVLTCFILHEGNRIGLRKKWLPIIATFCVGVSLGLPLFLYLRENQLKG